MAEKQPSSQPFTPVPVVGDSGEERGAAYYQDTEVAVHQYSQGELIWYRFRHHRLALIGAVMMTLLVAMAIAAPLISPETYLNGWDFTAISIAPHFYLPGSPHWKMLLGTDAFGHTILMWIAYGARVSLAVGVVAAVLTTVLGIVIGGISGYFGGWTDTIIMRLTDVVLTLPFLPIVILMSYYISGGSWVLIVVIFAIFGWPTVARLVRSYYLTFRSQEFTEAARAVGVSDTRIIFRHILPNTLSPIIVSATLLVASYIVSESAIDFLGVGIHPPTVSWGLALANAQNYLSAGNWWWAFFPGLFILLTVLAINFVGDGLRDALDVRGNAE